MNEVPVPEFWANQIPVEPWEAQRIAALREGGCRCGLPLLGSHEGTVRCRLCNTEVPYHESARGSEMKDYRIDGPAEAQSIIREHKACETAPNGTGSRCTCDFDCANYWLRARGYKAD